MQGRWQRHEGGDRKGGREHSGAYAAASVGWPKAAMHVAPMLWKGAARGPPARTRGPRQPSLGGAVCCSRMASCSGQPVSFGWAPEGGRSTAGTLPPRARTLSHQGRQRHYCCHSCWQGPKSTRPGAKIHRPTAYQCAAVSATRSCTSPAPAVMTEGAPHKIEGRKHACTMQVVHYACGAP